MREIRFFLSGLVLGGAFTIAGSTWKPEPRVYAQAPAAEGWEYQCFEEWGDNGAKVAKRANELGTQGWEMVAAAARSVAAPPAWCFKRPLR